MSSTRDLDDMSNPLDTQQTQPFSSHTLVLSRLSYINFAETAVLSKLRNKRCPNSRTKPAASA